MWDEEEDENLATPSRVLVRRGAPRRREEIMIGRFIILAEKLKAERRFLFLLDFPVCWYEFCWWAPSGGRTLTYSLAHLV
jgi:hypothetical protein